LLSFKYGGIRKNIASICLFEIFYFIGNNTNTYYIKIMDNLTKYTAGIYFLHTIIGHGYFMRFILGNKIKTINGCFILYIISYMVCFIMDKLIGKTKFMHLIK
jgi:surface polysaccharide O-acyltransferase-like enzyme